MNSKPLSPGTPREDLLFPDHDELAPNNCNLRLTPAPPTGGPSSLPTLRASRSLCCASHIVICIRPKTPASPLIVTAMRVFASAILLFTAAVSAEPADLTDAVRSLQSSSQCLAQERLYDYTGNDISNLLATVDGCCSACASTTACNAYTWTKYQGGSCYLKTKKAAPVYKGTDTDGSAYFISGLVYKCQPVQTNRDLAGIDLKNVTASQPEGCCAECRQTTGCSGFAWNSYNGGTCYLKTGPVLRVATTNVYSAVL